MHTTTRLGSRERAQLRVELRGRWRQCVRACVRARAHRFVQTHAHGFERTHACLPHATTMAVIRAGLCECAPHREEEVLGDGAEGGGHGQRRRACAAARSQRGGIGCGERSELAGSEEWRHLGLRRRREERAQQDPDGSE
eukprot:6193705-Pleurochrysis_carterae.AAC.1